MTNTKANAARALQFKPHHFGVSVRNLESAIAWYRDVLGFALERRFGVETVPFKAAFMQRQGFHIEIFEVGGAKSLPEDRRVPNADLKTHGNKHMAFESADIHGLFAHFKEQGVDIAWDVFPMDGTYGGFIRDDTGNLIEFVQM